MDKNHTLTQPAKKRSAGATLPLGDKLAYNTKEASEALSISARSLKRLEERGRIRACKALRHKIYSRRELERFLEENS